VRYALVTKVLKVLRCVRVEGFWVGVDEGQFQAHTIRGGFRVSGFKFLGSDEGSGFRLSRPGCEVEGAA
jgi:hypothetical protein